MTTTMVLRVSGTQKSVSNKMPTGAQPFVRVIKNLYALPTPLAAGATSLKIEDFFDDAIKATVISGKKFNDGNSIDTDKEYGKKVFAHQVVQTKASTIDFTGFRPLLTNLTAAINEHKASVDRQPPGDPFVQDAP